MSLILVFAKYNVFIPNANDPSRAIPKMMTIASIISNFTGAFSSGVSTSPLPVTVSVEEDEVLLEGADVEVEEEEEDEDEDEEDGEEEDEEDEDEVDVDVESDVIVESDVDVKSKPVVEVDAIVESDVDIESDVDVESEVVEEVDVESVVTSEEIVLSSPIVSIKGTCSIKERKHMITNKKDTVKRTCSGSLKIYLINARCGHIHISDISSLSVIVTHQIQDCLSWCRICASCEQQYNSLSKQQKKDK
jgi:hypothetical protein